MAKKQDELAIISGALAQVGGLERITEWAAEATMTYKTLMSYYRCAMMEIETKFKVLNEEFSVDSEANPVEGIKCRIKSPDSLFEKLLRRGIQLTPDAIMENINDVAGIRVICSTKSDVYMLAEALLMQPDVELVEEKDYIKSPKPSGYRSLHLIVATPINLNDGAMMMKVEVQLRTLAMDVWASLEHKIKYKKDLSSLPENADTELAACAALCAEVDDRMQALRDATK